MKRGESFVSTSLMLHETNPGHHLQQALAQENRDLPGFRRVGHWHAFVEGWAMYAEDLGFEMGLYDHLDQAVNKLAGDEYHASRLAIDVGLHVKGWTREQALAFMRQNLIATHLWGDTTTSYASSVDRQIAWPGYALGYTIGQFRFRELRARAEKKLGARFDLRAFHDEVLKDGALPLDILDAKMERWIAQRAE